MGGYSRQANMANPKVTRSSTAVCTIASCNYAAYAKTLQESMRISNPEMDFFVLLVDRKNHKFESEIGFDRIIWVEDLNIPNFHHLAFKFDILELNTDVKPFVLQYLASRYEYVFYLDPDIYVYGSLKELVTQLEGKTAIITPHTVNPINDNKKPSEIDFMRAGAYNLGFFGARNCTESMRLLDWWGRRCVEFGYNDLRQGLFVDQKFIDLLPSFFDGVVIERSPIYNVAYWNLHERHIDARDPEHPIVNNQQLVFFHFSGLSVDSPAEPRLEVSKYQNRSDFSNRPDIKPLFEVYREKLFSHGHRDLRNLAYSFGNFSNGERINAVSRRLFGLINSHVDSSINPFDAQGPIYLQLAKLHALGGHAQDTISSYNAQKYSRAMRFMESLLRFAFRLLGPERYSILMNYLGYIASLRNQRDIFFRSK